MRTAVIVLVLSVIANLAAGKEVMTWEITGALGDQQGGFAGFAELQVQQKNFKWTATLTHFANGIADWSLNYAAKHDSGRDGVIELYAQDSVMTFGTEPTVEVYFISSDQRLVLLPLP